MARRLSRRFAVSFLIGVGCLTILAFACRPTLGGEKKEPESPPSAKKEAPSGDGDKQIEKAFGKDAKELKRPIRVWIADLGMALAASMPGLLAGANEQLVD